MPGGADAGIIIPDPDALRKVRRGGNERCMEFTEVLKIFLTAMLPVVELRGALPLAIAKGMQPVAALALCTAGNLLPVPFIILFARRLLGWMRRFAWLQRFSNWLERKAERNSARLARGEFLGLMILVVIPLPGTGAWTGALVASLLGMRLRSSLPAIFLGVVIAGCIMLALSLGVNAVI